MLHALHLTLPVGTHLTSAAQEQGEEHNLLICFSQQGGFAKPAKYVLEELCKQGGFAGGFLEDQRVLMFMLICVHIVSYNPPIVILPRESAG